MSSGDAPVAQHGSDASLPVASGKRNGANPIPRDEAVALADLPRAGGAGGAGSCDAGNRSAAGG